MLEKLQLAEAQKKDLEKLQFDVAKQRIAQHAKVKTAMTELRQLQKAESPDKTALEKKNNELADFQAQTKIIGSNHWFAVNKMLTADQQKVWKKVLARPLRGRETLKNRIMQRILSTMLDRRIPFAPRGPVR